MKQFIVFFALMFIFIFMLLQWTANETSHIKRNTLINIVESHAQDARKDGYFTSENISSLKEEIHSKLYIPENEIRVSVTDTPKYRTDTFDENELIRYKIEVPIKNVVAMASFFDLGESENMYWYSEDGAVTSERLIDK